MSYFRIDGDSHYDATMGADAGQIVSGIGQAVSGLASGISSALGKKPEEPKPDLSKTGGASSSSGPGFMDQLQPYLPYLAVGLGGLLLYRVMKR